MQWEFLIVSGFGFFFKINPLSLESFQEVKNKTPCVVLLKETNQQVAVVSGYSPITGSTRVFYSFYTEIKQLCYVQGSDQSERGILQRRFRSLHVIGPDVRPSRCYDTVYCAIFNPNEGVTVYYSCVIYYVSW